MGREIREKEERERERERGGGYRTCEMNKLKTRSEGGMIRHVIIP
jgi:hypothetical protein